MLAPRLLKRLLMLLPSNVAPPGDRKRDKDYQHRVLGGRRAPLISPQAIDQTRHVQSFLVEYSGRPARGPTANGFLLIF